MLQGKSIITPSQKESLEAFSGLSDQEQFYLAGGTALAEWHLGHRQSLALDFFTGERQLIGPFSHALEETFQRRGWQVSVKRRFATYVEFLLTRSQESVRLELALDSPFKLSPVVPSEHGVFINGYEDLVGEKVLAFYGRVEPRDAVDLFFILQREPLDKVLGWAGQKDAGFDMYWFIQALQKVEAFPDEAQRWPVQMLVPFDPVALKQSFRGITSRLIGQTLPP